MLSISFFQTVMSIVEMISLSAAIFHLLFTWRAVAIQLLSQLFCNPMDCSTSGFPFPIPWSLLRFMPIESVMPSNHLILYWPLLFLPSIFPSIRVSSNESILHIRCPKYWSFSFRNSFRIEWFDLLAVQGTVKSLLQHHSSKASILLHSAFFMVPLSHPYMTTVKTIALTRQILTEK